MVESIDELKKELTNWLDDRIAEAVKAGVDEANTDIKADIADLKTNVLALPNMVSDLVRNDISAVQQGITSIVNLINNLNPFHLGE